jgi:hypothetical protein
VTGSATHFFTSSSFGASNIHLTQSQRITNLGEAICGRPPRLVTPYIPGVFTSNSTL